MSTTWNFIPPICISCSNCPLWKASKQAIIIHNGILYSPTLYYSKPIIGKEFISLIEIFTVIPGYGNQTISVLITWELPDRFKAKPKQEHDLFGSFYHMKIWRISIGVSQGSPCRYSIFRPFCIKLIFKTISNILILVWLTHTFFSIYFYQF